MIELQRVSLRAGNFALHDISLRVESGEYAVLMGRTGRGKTTLLEAICGLRKVESGRIVLHGDDVTEWSPADRQIGYVPQDLALFPTLTVRPGETLVVDLVATAPDGDVLTFSVDTLHSGDQLPDGRIEGQGRLTFAPRPDQLGSYQFDIVATAYSSTLGQYGSDPSDIARQTVTLNVVPDPVTTTRLAGFVLILVGILVKNRRA